MKQNDLIVDLLKEVRDEQKEHSRMLTTTQIDIAEVKVDLAKHIEGVVQNRKRIEALEEPRKAFAVLKSYVLGTGAIAGAILGLIKLSKYL